jgi:hypothetical protein
MLKYNNFIKVFCGSLYLVHKSLEEEKSQNEIFSLIFQLFSNIDAFDKCMVFFVRKLTANFLSDPNINNKSANGISL